MNRITKTMVISMLLIIVMPMARLSAQTSIWDGSWEPWNHGTGTEADPFLIENAQQLAYLAYRVNNGLDAGGGHVSNHDYHYELMVDVDLNGSEDFQWTPIGYWNSDADYQCFGGHFDGNNHTIWGLYFNSLINRAGLFGYTNEASIANLNIDGTVIVTEGNAGGLVGYATSTYVNNVNSHCRVSAIGSLSYSGGIIGVVSGVTNIRDCYNSDDVSSSNGYESHAGGIVGHITGSTIIMNCGNSGNIASEHDSGGIVGILDYHNNIDYNTNIDNCYNTGNVLVFLVPGASDWCYCGGIVGLKWYGSISVSNCYNTGSITISGTGSELYASGIIGANNAMFGSVTNSYNVGSISVEGNAGGIGCVQTGSINITNSYYLNTCGGNNTYGGVAMTSTQMRDPQFVTTLNQGQITPVWESDYAIPINDGYPILEWQLSGVGINENGTVDCTISPNPTNDKVIIKAEGFKHVSISNMLGQTVYDSNAFGNTFEYDFSQHRAGIYLICIETSSGMVVKKVSVTR